MSFYKTNTMKKIFISVLISIIALAAYSQDTCYFKKANTYYPTLKEKAKYMFVVQQVNDSIRKEEFYQVSKHQLLWRKMFENEYNSTGIWLSYNKKGKLLNRINFDSIQYVTELNGCKKKKFPDLNISEFENYIEPKFGNGKIDLYRYLGKNTRYPIMAREMGIQGIIIVQFVVSENGETEDICIQKSIHPLLDNEAIRLIKEMPKWTPGKLNGENVRVQFNLPIKFLTE